MINWVRDFNYSLWASFATEAAKETRLGTKVVYGMRMMPERRTHAQRREIARYHTQQWKHIATCDVSFCDGALTSPNLLLLTSVTTSHVTCFMKLITKNQCKLLLCSFEAAFIRSRGGNYHGPPNREASGILYRKYHKLVSVIEIK